jgi:hypothetical protein
MLKHPLFPALLDQQKIKVLPMSYPEPARLKKAA